MSEVEEILKERGSKYGHYKTGKIVIRDIMIGLNTIHQKAHGTDIPVLYQTMLYDIVAKVARLGATPVDYDTLLDIEGYARLYRSALEHKDA